MAWRHVASSATNINAVKSRGIMAKASGGNEKAAMARVIIKRKAWRENGGINGVKAAMALAQQTANGAGRHQKNNAAA